MSDRLRAAIDHAAELLPAQGPISVFIHHNTLHAFEDLPFEQAVVEAGRRFGCEPFLTEARFHEEIAAGRITEDDLVAVLGNDATDVRLAMLRNPIPAPRGAALRWLLDEIDGLTADLWETLVAHARTLPPLPPATRPATRVDPLLIRAVAAFLDQGIATWPMPDRELGFYRAFRRLCGCPILRDEEARGLDALGSATESLAALGVPESEWAEYVGETLLPVRGWAGMMRVLERDPNRAPVAAPPCSLADFVAVKLHFDRREGRAERAVEPPPTPEERAYPVFRVAIATGRRDPKLFAEVEAFGELERRRVLQLAYERNFHCRVLDALARPPVPTASPSFQAIFCLDEREESLRRHLEEVEPRCETFGTAGFFGVAMYYRDAGDPHWTPLCPIQIRPEHTIEEEFSGLTTRRMRRAAWRRGLGLLQRHLSTGSRTLARGAFVATGLGALASLPLVARVLFPRTTSRLRRRTASWLEPTGKSRLRLDARPGADLEGTRRGFTVEEMRAIVSRLLDETGLRGKTAPLVLVVGHGSSSLNNPHESAHDCGACGGGRGGPNARAFAAMANDPRVGLAPGTWFVGGVHNSCDDSIEFFDTDLIPNALRAKFEAAATALDEACLRNAHERSRRFGQVPLDLPPAEARRRMEAQSEDLAQPRPEYGHATNAFAFIGRRERTRGLFLDRRAFLISYDPDDDGTRLARVLGAVIPVVAGISLEYYFSFVDPTGYGCGTKLPHNIVSLLGVMDGHQSDLRTGLPWQMVEIHEPVRLLVVVETRPETLDRVVRENPAIRRLVENRWIFMTALPPDAATVEPAVVHSSLDAYRGARGHLPFAHLNA